MKRLILFLFVLFVVVVMTLQLMMHPGQMILVYAPWTIIIPLWVFLLMGMLVLLFFYCMLSISFRIRLFLMRLKHAFFIYKIRSLQKKTNHGLIAIIENNWKHAESDLLAGATHNDQSLINYLGAAKAAHEQGIFDKRNCYLQKAYNVSHAHKTVVSLVQAQFALSQKQLEQAVAILVKLKQHSPKHPRVLYLLQSVYVQLKAWDALYALLPCLRKAKVFSVEEQTSFELMLFCQRLKTLQVKAIADIRFYFSEVPRYLRDHPKIVSIYLERLSFFKETTKERAALICKILKKTWSFELAEHYIELSNINVRQQLLMASRWLRYHGEQASILFILGKLCMRAQLWGKAREYFHQCLALQSCPDAALAYGSLLEQLDDKQQALHVYKTALSQCR